MCLQNNSKGYGQILKLLGNWDPGSFNKFFYQISHKISEALVFGRGLHSLIALVYIYILLSGSVVDISNSIRLKVG